MNRNIMLAFLLASSLAGAQEPAARRPIMLMKAGEIGQPLVDRLKQWVETELALPLPVAESLEPDDTSLEASAAAAAARLAPEDLGAIVLNTRAGGEEPHGIYRPDLRVVVINVTDMREGADEETLARRLERQVIRGVGVLLGLSWSPNPESAMAAYTTLAELDQMGRNLDPPWLIKLQERARDLGLPLDPDNPNNLIRE